MSIRFTALPTAAVRAAQSGAPDAYGLAPEPRISDGDGVPCRHCLRSLPEGVPYLVLAWRPFETLQPYAETGPIFLCAEPCARAEPRACVADGSVRPEILDSPSYLVRGYDAAERIAYGSGGVVPTDAIPARAAELLARPEIAFLHVRSAANNCFQVRIERG
ncbi:MAG: DUF1203 domain-containing protein [Pseudomonadota bacterium]